MAEDDPKRGEDPDALKATNARLANLDGEELGEIAIEREGDKNVEGHFGCCSSMTLRVRVRVPMSSIGKGCRETAFAVFALFIKKGDFVQEIRTREQRGVVLFSTLIVR